MSQWPPNIPRRVKLLNALGGLSKFTRRSDGSVNRCLMRFLDWPTSPSNKPINGVLSSDFTVDKSRDLYFRLYTPTAAGTSLPVIFFIHGGGFAYNAPSSKSYDHFSRRLAHELSAFIISVNYRLAPEHRYPAQIGDCFDALKFIDSTEIEGFPKNADLKRFFMAGDSAGANLVHHVTVKASEYEFSKLNHIGNISIQPFFGGEERTESEMRLTGALFIDVDTSDWMWKTYLPEGSNRDHPAANVFGPNSEDLSGIKYPATIVFKGGYDPMQDRQKRYYEGLKKYGKETYLVEYENAFHSFYAFPEVAESSSMLKEVKVFMQNQSQSHV